MAGLPKKYAKMGFKKGWKAYKGTRARPTSRRTSTRKIRRVSTMARRKTSRKSYGKKDIFSYIKKPVVGAVGVVAYEAFLSPMVSNVLGGNKMVVDMIELLGGAYLSKKQGILGATGKALVTLNSYQLVSGIANNVRAGGIGNLFSNSGNQEGVTPSIYSY